jgi:broad specificity phosphatase PhoE
MKVILVRHAETQWRSRTSRFHGRIDLDLSEMGRRQARATGWRIQSRWRPTVVYTSPLRRCVYTSELIARAVKAEVATLPGLIDLDYGQWQGLTAEQVKGGWREAFRTWQRAPHSVRIPGGESLQEVQSRVTGTLHAMLRRHARDTIVMVGHCSVNRVLLAYAVGLPLSRYRCFGQDYCGITELDVSAGLFWIRCLNETGHLYSMPERRGNTRHDGPFSDDAPAVRGPALRDPLPATQRQQADSVLPS